MIPAKTLPVQRSDFALTTRFVPAYIKEQVKP